MAQHQAKIEEAIEQAKTLQKAMQSGKMAENQILQANQMGSVLMMSRASFGGKSPRGVTKWLHIKLTSWLHNIIN